MVVMFKSTENGCFGDDSVAVTKEERGEWIALKVKS